MCIFVGFAGMAELVLKEWTYDVFVYVVTYNAIATQKVFGCWFIFNKVKNCLSFPGLPFH